MADAKKILIVDDESDVRTWLTTFFEDNGYATDTAVDGEEGFAKARAGGIDLITLDITMDNQSGVRMFRNLQKDPATDEIPVIMITGVAKEFKTFIERTKQVENPEGFFEKPVDRVALLAKVRELIG
ncbi:response regulator [bacterium]|nr:response regulator [bacterium]MBU1072295.1 response regulator [bacterium]MBU1676079.1 response regulator [bacterium]